MNSHAEIRTRLAAYSGGDLDHAERERIAAHLSSCPECRAELADLQTALRLVRSTPEVEPPPWLTARIMAHLKARQAEKRSWLQRLFLPLHVKLPLEAVAVLFVCVTGYYLSRTVETELKTPAGRPEMAGQTPTSAPLRKEEQKRDAARPVTVPPAPEHSPGPAPVPLSAPPTAAPAPAVQQVPRQTFAPPPPFKEERSVPSAAGKAEQAVLPPAAESYNRALEAAPEKKSKSIRSQEPRSESPAPAAADRAAGAPAGLAAAPPMIRLIMGDPSTAATVIREATLRSGGTVSDERDLPSRRLRIRIPADRIPELLERLERSGRIAERPAPPSGTQQMEITIQW